MPSIWLIVFLRSTALLFKHPGGVEVLLEHAGIDGTEDYEDVGHSTDAQHMKDDLIIGELVEVSRYHLNKINLQYPPISSAFHPFSVKSRV